MPTFSIIIPALNEEEFISNLLDDLCDQTFTDFEVFLVDGHSDDKTVAIAKKYRKKLNLKILNSAQRNVSIQRNLGGQQANSKWLIFFDADNQLPKYFLDGIRYNLLKTNDVHCFTTFIKPDTNEPQDITIATTSNYAVAASALVKRPYAFGAMIGVEKTVFNLVKGFNPKIKYQEDVDFIRKVVAKNLIFRVFSDPFIIYSFRRLRKEGTITMIRRGAQLQFKQFMKLSDDKTAAKIYPMLGGSFYKKKPGKDASRFKNLYQNLNNLTRSQTKSLKKLFQSLTEIE